MSAEINYNSQETAKNFIETLSGNQKNFLFGVINLNQRDLWLSLDLDGVLAKSEIPVFNYCDKDLGTHYSGRKLLGFESVTRWLLQDKIFDSYDMANAYEDSLWDNPDIIAQSVPNKVLQKFLEVAHDRKIPQIVNTSRPPHLTKITYDWVKSNYPYISSLNVRNDINIPGDVFKAKNVARLASWNPNVVHFEDSMNNVRKILEFSPNIGIIGFPYLPDQIQDVLGSARIYFPDIEIFESLLYY